MKSLTLVFCFVSVYAFSQKKEFGWLIGTWQEEGKQAFEEWKEDNSFLLGVSYQMKDGKKVITEEIKLIKKGEDFFYVPDVAGPQGPVEFKVTSHNKTSFIAKNPNHDFPTKIGYEKIDDTHVKASIGDANKTISYSFIKIK